MAKSTEIQPEIQSTKALDTKALNTKPLNTWDDVNDNIDEIVEKLPNQKLRDAYLALESGFATSKAERAKFVEELNKANGWGD